MHVRATQRFITCSINTAKTNGSFVNCRGMICPNDVTFYLDGHRLHSCGSVVITIGIVDHMSGLIDGS